MLTLTLLSVGIMEYEYCSACECFFFLRGSLTAIFFILVTYLLNVCRCTSLMYELPSYYYGKKSNEF